MHFFAAPIVSDGEFCSSTIRLKGGDLTRIGVKADEFGKAPQQKRVVLVDAYPMCSFVRQEKERKAREEQFVEQGFTPHEIKVKPRKAIWMIVGAILAHWRRLRSSMHLLAAVSILP